MKCKKDIELIKLKNEIINLKLELKYLKGQLGAVIDILENERLKNDI